MFNSIKRIVLFILALTLCSSLICLPVFGEEPIQAPSVSAKAAILITADSRDIIFSKEHNEKLPMASTTKIMTALLALEKIASQGDILLTITDEMVRVEGSSMGLRAGDRLMASAVVTGLMLASGNDAANTLAYYVSGSPEEFASLMNEKAAEIGMLNSQFVTPSGLDDENHYSTAYDMALLAVEALENDIFREIVSCQKTTVDFKMPEKTVWYTNHNSMLKNYDGCIGVKTGFTKKSGRCLVSAAQRNGVTLISVTLNAPDDWNDHTKLLDFGFTQTEQILLNETELKGDIAVVGGEKERLKIKGTDAGVLSVYKENVSNMKKIVCLPKIIYSSVQKGEIVGYVYYYCGNKKLACVPIVADEDIDYKEKEGFFERIFGWIK